MPLQAERAGYTTKERLRQKNEAMNNTQEVQQIVDFYSTIEVDSRIGLKHISLYMALLSEYINGSSQLPIYVNRDRLMISQK